MATYRPRQMNPFMGGVNLGGRGIGNPDFVGGQRQVRMPNGQVLNIANPIAQAMLNQQSYNKGRWGVGDTNVFKRGRTAQGAGQYSDYGAVQDQLNRMAQRNPNILNSNMGSTGFKTFAMKEQNELNKYGRMKSQLAKPQTERRSAAGAFKGGFDVAGKQRELEQQRKKMQQMKRPNRTQGRARNFDANKLAREFGQMSPTVSNVRVKERVQPQNGLRRR